MTKINAGREKEKNVTCDKCSEIAVAPVRYADTQKFAGSRPCCQH